MAYQLRLYEESSNRAWTPKRGKGSKQTFPSTSIVLVGVHLTPQTSKLDMNKLNQIIAYHQVESSDSKSESVS